VISPAVRLKVLIFAIVTALGVSYVLVHYIGVGQSLFGSQYTAYVDLADSGGIFPSAGVTYRGVDVGRVTGLSLRPQGIRVALKLDGKHAIPADTKAVVGNGSAIGEQYIDLQPPDTGGPFLRQGSVIPQSQTSLPISSEDLLVNLDQLVKSVPKTDLTTTIDEAGKAFGDTGPALQRLLDSSTQLLDSARAHTPQTVGLIDNSQQVLDTQNFLHDDIVGFSQHLASLSTQLRNSDPDIRTILNTGPPAAQELGQLMSSLDTTLPMLLNNLVSLGQITQARINDLKSVFIIYPYVAATAFSAFPGGHTTFVVPQPTSSNPPDCNVGFNRSYQHQPTTETYNSYPWDFFCQAPTSSDIAPRGARMATTPDGTRLGDTEEYKHVQRPQDNVTAPP
jgi:phospholipid/cholesterol/gamma-HCH transport system substrate-binding protein